MLNIQNTRIEPNSVGLDRSHRYERAAEASKYFRIGRSTLWLWVKTRPGFPKPYRIGDRVTVFDLDEIESFLRSQVDREDRDGNAN